MQNLNGELKEMKEFGILSKKNTTLSELSLKHSDFKDKGMIYLTNLFQNNNSIKWIEMCTSNFSDVGLKSISEVMGNKIWKKLFWIQKNHKPGARLFNRIFF